LQLLLLLQERRDLTLPILIDFSILLLLEAYPIDSELEQHEAIEGRVRRAIDDLDDPRREWRHCQAICPQPEEQYVD